MQTPFPVRDATRRLSPRPASTRSFDSSACEWRCTQCNKLLGVRRDDRMHLRFARSHEYFAGFPIVATCRGCGTLNQAAGSAR
jgi:hypothetical protein